MWIWREAERAAGRPLWLELREERGGWETGQGPPLSSGHDGSYWGA